MDLIKVTLHGIGKGKGGPSSGPTNITVELCTKNQFFDNVDCTIEMVKAAHDDFQADP